MFLLAINFLASLGICSIPKLSKYGVVLCHLNIMLSNDFQYLNIHQGLLHMPHFSLLSGRLSLE